ncbi:MAG: glycosyltransferase family 4 protein [Nannocystaceae bacterium]|nr:glycosyltransferase family 4 protein [bacterium]
MHILYLHQYFVGPDGSGGTRSFEMARRWVQWGHRVTMVTSSARFPRGKSKSVTHTRIEGIDVIALPVAYRSEMSHAARLEAFASFALQASGVALKTNADVVFASSTPLTIAIPAIVGSRLRRVPMVFEVRDLWPDLPIAVGALRSPAAIWSARALEALAYRSSTDVIALSPGMAEGVARCGITPERIHVIPNACDVEEFAVDQERADAFVAERIRGDGPLVVYAGSFGAMNDAAWLVDVAAATEGFRFAFVGEGPGRAEIEARARRAGLLDRRVFVLPALPKREVPYLLRGATVATSLFLPVPAMEHNSANKFFDALAAGCPVAINYGGWQAELLEDTGAGLVLTRTDPARAAQRLRRAASDPRWCARASAAAETLARERFDRDRLARRALDVVEGAVA